MTQGKHVVLLAVAFLAASGLFPGCGGKYDKPLEVDRTIRMGEYIYVPAYRGFENATGLSIAFGTLYVAYADTVSQPPTGEVRAYFSDAEPVPANLVVPFTGLTRPTAIGAGKRAIAVADISDQITVKVYGLSGGAPNLTFTDPAWRLISGLAVDDSGNIYVCDAVKNFVRSYKPDGRRRFQVELADSGFGIGHVMRPMAIAIDGTTLLIAEAHAEKVQVQRIRTDQPQTGIPFSAQNPYISAFTDSEGNEMSFVEPAGVAAGLGGGIFVLDRGLGKIFRFDAEANSITVVNSPSSGGPSELYDGSSLCTYNRPSSEAIIYVLDRVRGVIHRWDPK
jgi:hypothetical protein